jgi:hypothetical protein
MAMYPFYSAREGGFSRLQTIFGLVVLLIFATTLYYFISGYFKLHSTEHALENAKMLDLLLAQFATDNNDTYPVGEGTRAPGKSEGIALELLQNQFTPNPDLFTVGWTPRYSGNAKDYADLAPENMSWDFTAGADSTTGIPANAPDLLPVLYSTGQNVIYRPGQGVTLTGNGPFSGGMIVALKSGAVDYRTSVNGAPPTFLSPDFKDTGTYTQIKP